MFELRCKLLSVLVLVLNTKCASASEFYYMIDGASSMLVDLDTGIGDLHTPFLDKPFEVITELSWASAEAKNSSQTIGWSLFIDDDLVSSGDYVLDPNLQLPTEINTGEGVVTTSGHHTVKVVLKLDDEMVESVTEIESYHAILSLVPLLVIMILAVTLNIIEVSMGFGVFVGACMVTGSVKGGFTRVLDVYLIHAMTDEDHVYVYLFTFFLSAVVALMEKSGGLAGFANAISRYAKTPRSGQLIAFGAGLTIFFDDYANTLVIGQMFRPITDELSVSCEKLAFLVDATAAPIASIMPISSWAGFEVGMIHAELNKIRASDQTLPSNFPVSGMDAFLNMIQYSYYSIFMLMFVPLLAIFGRDFGPMLIAERKVTVYGRTDGGDGSETEKKMKGSGNEPNACTPLLWYNMIIPLVLLVFLIFYLLVKTGDDGSGTQTITNKIQESHSFLALLLSTMGVALIMLLLFSIQIVEDKKVLMPTPDVLKRVWQGYRSKTEAFSPRPLMTLHEFVESFICGMEGIFPALIVLTLAWTVGTSMTEVGADRLFASWINSGGIPTQLLPTLSYIISMFMALATGSSWGVMTIMFPLIIGPTWSASENVNLLYATIAGILSGAILGDHISPISDTTVLSSLASGCKLMNHVITQAPYAIIPGTFAMIWGTLPVAYQVYPNGVGILLGFLTMVFFAFFYAVKRIHPKGNFDIVTELYLKLNKDSELHGLKKDTIEAYALREAGEDLRECKLGESKTQPTKLEEGDSDSIDLKQEVEN